MWPKAELVIYRRLIGESDAQFSDRPEQHADVAAERFVPGLETEAPVRQTWKCVVYLRLEEETTDRKTETSSNRQPVVYLISY